MPRQFSIDWFPLVPGWGIAVMTLGLLALVAWGSSVLAAKQIPRRWVVTLGILRAVAVILFALCLLQPALSYIHGVPRPPELLVLVDTSASMAHKADDDRTRLATAVDELERSKLLEKLGDQYQVRLFGFDRRAYPLDTGDLKSLKAEGPATEFAKGLATAVELTAAEQEDTALGSAPKRVLLVSDGQDRGSDSFAEAAVRQGAVVDVLVAGDERAAGRGAATIVGVQASPRVLLASETQFLVTVERGDATVQDFTLSMYEDGRAALTQNVSLAAGVKERHVRVAYRPTEVGLKQYEFDLKPAKAAASNSTDERYGVNVQVVDEKIEVLALEDRWRWEFKFFKRVLEDDPSFNLTAMLARGGGAFLQLGEPERRVNLGGFPQSRAELDWFDVIVLGDVKPTRWPGGLSGAVADSVIEGGKSLVVVAGPALAEIAQSPDLNALLPVDLSTESADPIEGPLDVRLTPEGAQSGLFAGGDGATAAQLPTIDRIYPPIRKRPGATVLLEAAGEANAAGRLIVLAEQTVGRGRVLYVGTDALWKWQTLGTPDADGRTLYGTFWQQALRTLAPPRTSAAAGLWLTTDRTRHEAGDRVRLQADAPLIAENDRAKLEATIVVPDGRRLPLTFEPDPKAIDAFVAEFDATTPGRYRVSLSCVIDGQPAAEASQAIEVVAARGETDDVGVDRAALEEIARRTGGRVINPDDPQTWPTPGTGLPPTVEERRTVNLWENFTLLTLLCLVLGGDWLMRLLRGYV